MSNVQDELEDPRFIFWRKVRSEYGRAVEPLLKDKIIGKKTELGVFLLVSPEVEDAMLFYGIDEDFFLCSQYLILRKNQGDIDWMGPRVKLFYENKDFAIYYRILSKENDTMKYPYAMCPRCRKYKPECGTLMPESGANPKEYTELCYRCDDYMKDWVPPTIEPESIS